jgi:hypothetical protein
LCTNYRAGDIFPSRVVPELVQKFSEQGPDKEFGTIFVFQSDLWAHRAIIARLLLGYRKSSSACHGRRLLITHWVFRRRMSSGLD